MSNKDIHDDNGVAISSPISSLLGKCMIRRLCCRRHSFSVPWCLTTSKSFHNRPDAVHQGPEVYDKRLHCRVGLVTTLNDLRVELRLRTLGVRRGRALSWSHRSQSQSSNGPCLKADIDELWRVGRPVCLHRQRRQDRLHCRDALEASTPSVTFAQRQLRPSGLGMPMPTKFVWDLTARWCCSI